MLLQATMEDVQRYGDFAYQLALNPQQSCDPTYTDGIKTKADFQTTIQSLPCTPQRLTFRQLPTPLQTSSFDSFPASRIEFCRNTLPCRTFCRILSMKKEQFLSLALDFCPGRMLQ